jgi:hypothetical protein
VGGGAYPPQTIWRGSHSQAGPAITFVCGSGQSCNVRGLSLGNGNSQTSSGAPSHLAFDGINISDGAFVAFAGAPNGPQPTDIAYKNAHIWCMHNIAGAQAPNHPCGTHLIYLKSTDHFTARNVEIGPCMCNADAVSLATGVTTGPNPSNITLDGVYIHDLYDNCANVPAAIQSQYGSCAGLLGYGNDGCCDHVDGIQALAGDNVTIKNSRFYAINPRSSTTTGAAQCVFVESQNGGTESNWTFINNMMMGCNGTNPVSFGNSPQGLMTGYWRFYYNSIPQIDFYDAAGNGIFGANATVEVVGNIIRSRILHSNNSTSCSYTRNNGTVFAGVFHNNEWETGTTVCDPATETNAAAAFVSSNFFAPDLHLANATQWAVNHGEAVFCPATDIDGTARPINGVCDVGAYEAG